MGYLIQAIGDGYRICRWRPDPPGQEPRADASDRAVNHIEQATPSLAGKGAHQFQIGSGCRVNFHRTTDSPAARRQQPGQPSLLCQLKIVNQSPSSSQLSAGERAKPLERTDTEQSFQTLGSVGTVKTA